MTVLAVCRKCYKSIGKKGGWKRASITNLLEQLAAENGSELVMTGCLDVCPKKGVTYGFAPSRKKPPAKTDVIRPVRQNDNRPAD